jgi:hypothetical protein
LIAEAPRHDPLWLAARGARQADLAQRFIEAAEGSSLRLLALKGIAIADEIYAGSAERPMADVDLLVIDTDRFAEAAALARSLGLADMGASDHALALREPSSRVILELHRSLTACPGLFPIDFEDLWRRRVPVSGASFSRLDDEALALHAALHTAFQHGFAANEYHYGDFVRILDILAPSPDRLLARAREWDAVKTLASMALMAGNRFPESAGLARLNERLQGLGPPRLSKRIASWGVAAPEPDLATLAFVRLSLAPSRWRCLRLTLSPEPLPGTRPRGGLMSRALGLAETFVRARARKGHGE